MNHPPRKSLPPIIGMLLAAALAFLAGCDRDIPSVHLDSARPDWKPLFAGVSELAMKTDQPRPMRLYALRVSLIDPGVRVLVSPAKNRVAGTYESMTTGTFLQRNHCQAAVNGSPFSGAAEREGQAQHVWGYSVSNGILDAKSSDRWAGMLFTRDPKARFVDPPFTPEKLAGVWNGLTGFGMILRQGQPAQKQDDDLHPRTAVGLSSDGNTMILLVIDGNQPSYSEGASFHETAQWIRKLGAWDAMMLDGGGSSTMAVADQDGKAQILNTPTDKRFPGTQRPVANHLGVFADKLK